MDKFFKIYKKSIEIMVPAKIKRNIKTRYLFIESVLAHNCFV